MSACWFVTFVHLGSPNSFVKALLLSVYMNVCINIYIYILYIYVHMHVYRLKGNQLLFCCSGLGSAHSLLSISCQILAVTYILNKNFN